MNATLITISKDISSSISPELQNKINNLNKYDIDGRYETFESLSTIFSLIPSHKNPSDTRKFMTPVESDWKKSCFEKIKFNREDYAGNNASIACGPASGILVLDVADVQELTKYLKNNNATTQGEPTFTVETGSGNKHYYFKYPLDGNTYPSRKYYFEYTDDLGIKIRELAFQIIGCDGNVLAPSSMHPYSQLTYKIIRNVALADPPPWIIEFVLHAEKKKQVKSPAIDARQIEVSEPNNCLKESFAQTSIIKQADTESQKRFKDHFGKLAGWGVDKQITTWSSPEEAFENSNYIAFPQFKRQYLCLDLDWEGAATIWMDEGLPEPTISFVNRANGHGTLAYELETPVHWPCEYNKFSVSRKAVNYFNAVRHGYTNLTGGDNGYVNSSIKNPFSNKSRVVWSDNVYELKYLAEFVKLPTSLDPYLKFKTLAFDGRNDELYHIGWRWSYRNVLKFCKLEDFESSMLEMLNYQNETTIFEHWPSRGLLPASEVRSISKGIAKYTWLQKDKPNINHLIKNYGALGFKPIDKDLARNEKAMTIYERQSAGAEYTHKAVKNSSLDKIDEAFNRLIGNGKKVSLRSVSNISGLSYNTVSINKDYINELKLKNFQKQV